MSEEVEEEKMSLVHTAAQTGETTPPSIQRHKSSNHERLSNDLEPKEPKEDAMLLDRYVLLLWWSL